MSTALRTLLLTTDGSADAAVASRIAAGISEKTGATLHVVHVCTDLAPLVYPPWYPPWVFDVYSHPLEEEARELLRRQAWKAQSAGERVVQEHLREGDPAEEIVALAEELDADLVVVCNRGAGRLRRLVAGSVSEGVVHRASCPVLVVRGGEEAWPIKRVVVGDDASRSARQAGKLATEIADAFGAGVVLVRAYENPPAPLGGWSAEDRRELDEARLRDLSALEGWAEQLGAMAQDRPDTKMLESKPAPAIVNVAGEAEETQTLIAVGSRGLSTPKRALNMEERMTQEKMAHLRPRFWLVARDGDHPLEMFTMGCGSAELLPVFSHVEEAEMFLDLGGAGDGWRTRESSAGEIVSLLFGLCSRVGSVALDPSPLMTPEMLDLVRVDRGRFVDLFTAPGEKKPLPRPRWVLNPGLTNRGVA